MVVTWWIVAFLTSVNRGEVLLATAMCLNYMHLCEVYFSDKHVLSSSKSV